MFRNPMDSQAPSGFTLRRRLESDGRIAAATTTGAIRVWNAKSGQQPPLLPKKHNGHLIVLNPHRNIVTVHTRAKTDPEGAWGAYSVWGDRNNPQPSYSVDLKR